ncbi:uncharacterized protein VP01_2841g1 [Puccinia sorghi]|uniref:tRNA-splicing endonuclease subunit Sen2 n=1 Tax=Puccinia sorghi TaxID=27349 RepID=A0A0L6V238_9BASI|nr:uncharacterized protein VP01_2841g1 [Puccinia sorghi]
MGAKPTDTVAAGKKPEAGGTLAKQEPAHSSAKRVRGPTNIYSKLLPIILVGNSRPEERPSFLSKLLPLLRPVRPSNFPGSSPLGISGHYDQISNSVWITAGRVILWQQGFFGKGSLSRSEPTWLQRAKNRKLLEVLEDDRYLKLTAEELTAKRRVERKESKIQKSKLKQLAAASESAVASESVVASESAVASEAVAAPESVVAATGEAGPPKDPKLPSRQKLTKAIPEELAAEVEKIDDLEHLQLMNEEAFFLTFGLGCLDVFLKGEVRALSTYNFHFFFCIKGPTLSPVADSSSRYQEPESRIKRSGRTIRSSCLTWSTTTSARSAGSSDRASSSVPIGCSTGPEAPFAVCMIPVYADGRPVEMMEDRTSWRWLGTVNRVCAGVKKTLILVHVVVPDEVEADDLNSPHILTKYIIKEIALKRFIPARMRD